MSEHDIQARRKRNGYVAGGQDNDENGRFDGSDSIKVKIGYSRLIGELRVDVSGSYRRIPIDLVERDREAESVEPTKEGHAMERKPLDVRSHNDTERFRSKRIVPIPLGYRLEKKDEDSLYDLVAERSGSSRFGGEKWSGVELDGLKRLWLLRHEWGRWD
jgi:hypothetical protein